MGKYKIEDFKNVEEIDKKIEELKEKRDNVKGMETEIYARIVGYLREIKDWNLGKKEEYNDRKNFKVKKEKNDKKN